MCSLLGDDEDDDDDDDDENDDNRGNACFSQLPTTSSHHQTPSRGVSNYVARGRGGLIVPYSTQVNERPQ